MKRNLLIILLVWGLFSWFWKCALIPLKGNLNEHTIIFDAKIRLHTDGHCVRLSDHRVINSWRDLAERHGRLHVGAQSGLMVFHEYLITKVLRDLKASLKHVCNQGFFFFYIYIKVKLERFMMVASVVCISYP